MHYRGNTVSRVRRAALWVAVYVVAISVALLRLHEHPTLVPVQWISVLVPAVLYGLVAGTLGAVGARGHCDLVGGHNERG
jgi:uncharacterized membrane protein YhaH (DUF805 family)